MGHSRPLFLYIRLFYKQLTVNICSIKDADDWIRTRVLWYRKRYQLCHNHCPPTVTSRPKNHGIFNITKLLAIRLSTKHCVFCANKSLLFLGGTRHWNSSRHFSRVWIEPSSGGSGALLWTGNGRNRIPKTISRPLSAWSARSVKHRDGSGCSPAPISGQRATTRDQCYKTFFVVTNGATFYKLYLGRLCCLISST